MHDETSYARDDEGERAHAENEGDDDPFIQID